MCDSQEVMCRAGGGGEKEGEQVTDRIQMIAYLSLRHRTIFYTGTLLILMACVCACVRARSCRCEYVCLGVVLLVQMGC